MQVNYRDRGYILDFVEFLKNSPVLVALVAVSKVFITSFFLEIPLNRSILIAPLVAIAVYGWNDITDRSEDSINQAERVIYSGPKEKIGKIIFVILYLSALSLSLLAQPGSGVWE